MASTAASSAVSEDTRASEPQADPPHKKQKRAGSVPAPAAKATARGKRASQAKGRESPALTTPPASKNRDSSSESEFEKLQEELG